MVKEDEKLIIEDGVTVLEPLSFVDCKAKEIIMPDSVENLAVAFSCPSVMS